MMQLHDEVLVSSIWAKWCILYDCLCVMVLAPLVEGGSHGVFVLGIYFEKKILKKLYVTQKIFIIKSLND